ncbi:MAG: RDD family protein [Bdellovibrionaceae bacterium]|nr:RDD family protein [Bdellovibrionales bacterium]MCB9085571.1 RDD family protein [Pseudobdellovibrionaceae bacterium]
MVIEDPNFKNDSSREEGAENTGPTRHRHHPLKLASPLDRLAAAVVDFFLVILPISTLAAAPFKKGIMKALILQDETDFILYLALLILTSGVVVVLYQTLMVWLFGATLGKMFWGLRVERLWKHRRPTFSASLIRSVFWLFDSILGFVPHLAVFANEKRRPLHDRVADTVVITLKDRGVRSPGVIEASFVHGVIAAFAVFALVLLSFNSFDLYMKSKSQDALVSSLEEEGSLCKSVGRAVEDWPADDDDDPDRLQVAMALFAAGEVAKSCLGAEVDLKLVRQGVESPLAYLAQSFVHADNAELSDRYLARVCEVSPDSDSCKMSQIVTLWTEEKWSEVGRLFDSLNKTNEHYILVWAVRHFVKRGEFEQATQYLEKIEPRRSLGAFLGMQRAKVYWGMRRMEEARAAASVAFETMGPTERVDLASWLCYEEVEQSCQGVSSRSCQILEKAVEDSDEYLVDSKVALTYIKQNECKKGYGRAYEELSRQIPLTHARRLLFALAMWDKKQISDGRQVLWELINNKEADQDFRDEAKALIISWASKSEDLEALRNDWEREKPDLRWRRLGYRLFRGYYLLSDYKTAFEISRNMGTGVYWDSMMEEQVIISAYHLGKKQEAWSLLKQYKPNLIPQVNQRSPASANSEFDVVTKVLQREFKGK